MRAETSSHFSEIGSETPQLVDMMDSLRNTENPDAEADPQETEFVIDAESAPSRVAERLRRAVKQAGGHNAVVARSGVKSGMLNRVLNGQEVKQRPLVALADACGVSVEWLATGRGDPERDRHSRDTVQPGNLGGNTVVVEALGEKLRRLTLSEAKALYSSYTLASAVVYKAPESVQELLFASSMGDYYEVFSRPDLGGPALAAEITAITEHYLARARTPDAPSPPPV